MSEYTSLNIVENGLAASSKSLYMIFIVGLAQIILDVQLIKFQLSLPWLMDVKIGRPDNLYVLYCVISLFAVWKFYLSKTTELTELMSLSLSKFFNSKLGLAFVRKYIFGPHEFSNSVHRLNGKHGFWETKVLGYSGGEDCSESMGFIWKDCANLQVYIGWDNQLSNSSAVAWNEHKDKWGLRAAPPWEHPAENTEHFNSDTSDLSSGYFKSLLVFFTSVYSIVVSFTTSNGLNVTLPIMSNLVLVNFIIYNRIFDLI